LGTACFPALRLQPIPRIQILNTRKQSVGCLQLHNKDNLVKFEDSKSSQCIECVAKSKAYTGKIFNAELAIARKKETGENIRESQLKDCFFVLWIEWENGVAYRRGDGVVTVEAWEEAKEEELVD
jgi:hypothetical protein